MTSPLPQEPQKERSKTIAKNSAWMALDNIFSLAGGTVASILVARIFGPVQMGYYSYVMWFVMLTSLLAGRAGLAQVTRKYIAEYMDSGRSGLARTVLRGMLLVQLLLGVACTLLSILVATKAVPSEYTSFAILGALAVLPGLLTAVPTGANMALEDFSSNVKASAVGNTINVLWVFLTLLQHGGLSSLAGGLLVSRLADVVIRYVYMRRNYRAAFEAAKVPVSAERLPPEEKRKITIFCLQSIVLQLLNMVVWDRSELFFLKHFSPIVQVAYYSVCFSLIQQLATLYRVFATAAGMSMLRRNVQDPEGALTMTGEMLRYMGLIAFPATLGLAALSAPLMTLFYGNRYLDAIPVLVIVGLFGSARALLLPLEQYVIASGRQDLLIKGTLITSVVNVGLAFWLIPRSGAIGAALCNGVSQAAGMLICWSLLKQSYNVPIAWGAILRTLLASLTMAAMVWLSVRSLPPVLALLMGVPLGVAMYLVFLRFLRCLEQADKQRLTLLGASLPRLVRPAHRRALAFLIPAPKGIR